MGPLSAGSWGHGGGGCSVHNKSCKSPSVGSLLGTHPRLRAAGTGRPSFIDQPSYLAHARVSGTMPRSSRGAAVRATKEEKQSWRPIRSARAPASAASSSFPNSSSVAKRL